MDEHKGNYVNQISQTEKTNVLSHLYVDSKKVDHLETESRLVVASGWDKGEIRRCGSKGTNF